MDETTTTPTVLGARLLAAREARQMTTDDVIDELKRQLPKTMVMSRTKLNHLERGVTAHPDPFDVERLAAIYGVTLASLSPELAAQVEAHRRFVVVDGDGPAPDTAGIPCSTERLAAVA